MLVIVGSGYSYSGYTTLLVNIFSGRCEYSGFCRSNRCYATESTLVRFKGEMQSGITFCYSAVT